MCSNPPQKHCSTVVRIPNTDGNVAVLKSLTKSCQTHRNYPHLCPGKTSSLRQFWCIQFSARLSQYCSLAPQQSWSHVEQHGALEMMVLGHIHNVSMIGAQQALLLCMTGFVKSCEQWLWSNRGMGTPWPRNHNKSHRMQIPFPWLGKSDNFYLFLSHKSWLYNFAAAHCCFACRKVQYSIWTCCEHPSPQGSVNRKWKPHAPWKVLPIWIHLFRPQFF